MTSLEIKEYLSILVDMEKHKYIQENTIKELSSKAENLGYSDNYRKPKRKVAYAEFGDNILSVGIVSGIIIAIIVLITVLVNNWKRNAIMAIIRAVLQGGVIGIVGGLVCGLVIGSIIAIVSKARQQREYDYEYTADMKDYNACVREDEKRVQLEISQRGFMLNEIKSLKKQHEKTCDNLKKLYSYNIIAEKYRSLVPVVTFYQYFLEERTFSLGFDQKTGDRGAYNIYADEVFQGIIIDKLDTVINKLDEIIVIQHQLVNEMRAANNKIAQLTSSVDRVNTQLGKVNASINAQTEIQNYNAQRTNAELAHLNTMNLIYKWSNSV